MKKVYIYILIIAFAIKPIYNITYLAYYQFNIEYITEAFCENKEKVELACNGKCHLAKQLQTDSSKQDNDNTLRVPTEMFSLVFIEKTAPLNVFASEFELNKKVNTIYNQNYAYILDYEYFRPPAS